MTIEHMLTISTGNLTKQTCDLLGGSGIEGVVTYAKGDYGWLIWVPPVTEQGNELPSKMPIDLNLCLAQAQYKGCTWLMVDMDVDSFDAVQLYDLPEYEW